MTGVVIEGHGVRFTSEESTDETGRQVLRIIIGGSALNEAPLLEADAGSAIAGVSGLKEDDATDL